MFLTSHPFAGQAKSLSPLEALSWNSFFRSVGMGFIGVFVPVYLFILGRQHGGLPGGLIVIACFSLIQRAVIMSLSIPMAKLVKKLGFRRSIFLGTVFEAAFFLLLIGARYLPNLVWLTAIDGGFAVLFYWLARLSLISTDGQTDHIGRSLGTLSILEHGSGILGPFAGAVIATLFGFDVLFVIGMLLLLFSSLPMFYMPPHHHKGTVSFKGFWNWCADKTNRWMAIGHLGRGLDDYVAGWAWTLFVFVFVGNLEVFGGLTSAVLLSSVLAVYIASSLFDHHRLTLGRVGAVAALTAAFRIVRGLAKSIPQLFLFDSATRIVTPFYQMGADGVMYLAAKSRNPLGFFAYREIIYSFAHICAAISLLFLASNPNVWWVMWLIGSLGVLLGVGLAVRPNASKSFA